MGLGKNRSRLGKWIDHRGIKQQWLIENTGLNKNTISKLVNEDKPPKGETMKKVLDTLRKIDPNINANDFWEL